MDVIFLILGTINQTCMIDQVFIQSLNYIIYYAKTGS